jgi:hypothetical protein
MGAAGVVVWGRVAVVAGAGGRIVGAPEIGASGATRVVGAEGIAVAVERGWELVFATGLETGFRATVVVAGVPRVTASAGGVGVPAGGVAERPQRNTCITTAPPDRLEPAPFSRTVINSPVSSA